MKHAIFDTIGAFVHHYFQYKQTALVDNMLQNDHHQELRNTLYNLDIYTAQLSTGTFKGTHRQLIAQLNILHQRIDLMAKNETITSITAIIEDRNKLETASSTERVIYEWYVIPNWIGKELIALNEVVLEYKGCYWWGRTTTGTPITTDHSIVNLFTMFNR